jgi:hypothetical protein
MHRFEASLPFPDDHGVLGQGDVRLGVANPLARFVLAELEGDAFKILESAEAVLDSQPLHQKVREVDEGVPTVTKARGKRATVPVGELHERRGADRAFEMDVEFGLRQPNQIPHGRAFLQRWDPAAALSVGRELFEPDVLGDLFPPPGSPGRSSPPA